MTSIGDLPEEDWIALAKYIIERDGEQELYQHLVEYSKNCAWLHSNKEREQYSLELHMSRIFDLKDWVGYHEFNKIYRPWVLEDDKKGVARCECESLLAQYNEQHNQDEA